jgi:hypothetical protein
LLCKRNMLKEVYVTILRKVRRCYRYWKFCESFIEQHCFGYSLVWWLCGVECVTLVITVANNLLYPQLRCVFTTLFHDTVKPADVDNILVEPAKSHLVCISDYLCNFSTFICWIPVYVYHAKWSQATVYTCLYWPLQYFRPAKYSKSLLCCLLSFIHSFIICGMYSKKY